MDLFSNFPTTAYTFLQLGAGGVRGNSIVAQTPANGIFKQRSGLASSSNAENVTSTSTLHIKPLEGFIATVGGKLVGHGIRKDSQDYRIVNVTSGIGGLGFDVLEHYTLTLQKEDLV